MLQTKTKANFELSRKAMDRLEFLEDGKIVISYITLQDNENVNAQLGDDEGLVEIERDIEGVEVAVLLKEKEGKNGFKASLRSKENVNVSDVCFLLGGGGHPRAAGCFVSGNLEQAKSKIIKAIKQEMR